MRDKKITLRDANYLASLKEGFCISDKYINANSNLKWKCKEGHEWLATYANVKNKTWCPYCAKVLKIRICNYCKKKYIPISNCQKFCSRKHFRKEYLKSKTYKLGYQKQNHDLFRKKWLKEYWKSDKYKKYKSQYGKTQVGKLISLRRHLKKRAIKNNYIETFTIKQFNDQVRRCNGICPGCNYQFNDSTRRISLDHKYPISKANKDYMATGIKRIYTIDDVQPLCLSCNSTKRDKIPKGLNSRETS